MCFSGERPEELLVRDLEEREEVEGEAADLVLPDFPELVTGVNIFLSVVLVGVLVVVRPDIVLFWFRD